MISTAKVQRLVRDLQSYEISINNFKQNYNYYPGDAPSFTPPGDGNNVVGFGGGCTNSYSNAEIFQVFAQLSQAKMISSSYIPYSPLNCANNKTAIYYGTLGGIVAPYTQVDSNAASALGPDGYGQTDKGESKITLTGQKDDASSNFYIPIFISASNVIPVETKLGSSPYNSNGQGDPANDNIVGIT